jgi:hypothetical protein
MKWVLAAKESQEQEIMAVAAQIVVGGRRLGAREKQHGQGFGEPGNDRSYGGSCKSVLMQAFVSLGNL